jgi:hypothetical protein
MNAWHRPCGPVSGTTPKGGLQASEYEARGLGRLETEGSFLVYRDEGSGNVLLSMRYANAREAERQMAFFREAYQDVVRRRECLMRMPILQGGKDVARPGLRV